MKYHHHPEGDVHECNVCTYTYNMCVLLVGLWITREFLKMFFFCLSSCDCYVLFRKHVE